MRCALIGMDILRHSCALIRTHVLLWKHTGHPGELVHKVDPQSSCPVDKVAPGETLHLVTNQEVRITPVESAVDSAS